MRFKSKAYNCNQSESSSNEVSEIESALAETSWVPAKEIAQRGKVFKHQAAYNEELRQKFLELNWIDQPVLSKRPNFRECTFLSVKVKSR